MSENGALSRRTVLSGAFAAAVSLSSGSILRQDRLVLGSGKHRYEWVPDWLSAPPGLAFGDTHGLAQDSQGRIYLAHTVHPSSASGNAIVVYDEDGKFLTSWGDRFRGGAHGLDIRSEGNSEFLYHCDTGKRQVVKTDLDGKVLMEWGVPEASGKYRNGEPFIPTNVAFSPDGGFYIADGYGSNWIHRYDAKGQYVSTFGGTGSEKGQTTQPHGLSLDTRGKDPVLLVADRGNRRIQVFDLEGQHVRFHADGMRMPCHFSLTGDEVLVPDLESIVTILDAENRVVTQLGDGKPSPLRDHPREDFIPGKFIHPHDAIFLRNGDILVAEWVPIGRVTLLRRLP